MEGDGQAWEGNWMMSACSGLNQGGGGRRRRGFTANKRETEEIVHMALQFYLFRELKEPSKCQSFVIIERIKCVCVLGAPLLPRWSLTFKLITHDKNNLSINTILRQYTFIPHSIRLKPHYYSVSPKMRR